VISGENGHGKTNLIEAIAWMSGAGSFRGAPDDALIRVGTDAAIIRATTETIDQREQLIEVEIPRVGRNRIQVNRQRVTKVGDLAHHMQVTVFSPQDLDLVKDGPALRRSWIDGAVAARAPRLAGLRSELERILRQRNALLRSAGGRLDSDAAFTLDVWDAKLADVGEQVRTTREALLNEMAPRLHESYQAVADRSSSVAAIYQSSWTDSLEKALEQARDIDVRRGVTTVGPHRDEILLTINDLPARTHASQGEQRSLALAMRLAPDQLVRDSGTAAPVLLLDDVFSELDPRRSTALLNALPEAQSILTTAAPLPPAAVPDSVVTIADSAVVTS